ncbi:MAG: hypothetical protein ACKOW9_04865 [Candidatus Paceibacterota bacterium]
MSNTVSKVDLISSEIQICKIEDVICAFVPESDIDAVFDLLSIKEWTSTEKKMTDINPFTYYSVSDISSDTPRPEPLKSVLNKVISKSSDTKIQAYPVTSEKYYSRRKETLTLTEKNVAPDGSLLYNLNNQRELLTLIREQQPKARMIGDAQIIGSVKIRTKVALTQFKGIKRTVYGVYRGNEKIDEHFSSKEAKAVAKKILTEGAQNSDSIDIRKEVMIGEKPFATASKYVTSFKAKVRFEVYEEKKEPKTIGWLIAGKIMTISSKEKQ